MGYSNLIRRYFVNSNTKEKSYDPEYSQKEQISHIGYEIMEDISLSNLKLFNTVLYEGDFSQEEFYNSYWEENLILYGKQKKFDTQNEALKDNLLVSSVNIIKEDTTDKFYSNLASFVGQDRKITGHREDYYENVITEFFVGNNVIRIGGNSYVYNGSLTNQDKIVFDLPKNLIEDFKNKFNSNIEIVHEEVHIKNNIEYSILLFKNKNLPEEIKPASLYGNEPILYKIEEDNKDLLKLIDKESGIINFSFRTGVILSDVEDWQSVVTKLKNDNYLQDLQDSELNKYYVISSYIRVLVPLSYNIKTSINLANPTLSIYSNEPILIPVSHSIVKTNDIDEEKEKIMYIPVNNKLSDSTVSTSFVKDSLVVSDSSALIYFTSSEKLDDPDLEWKTKDQIIDDDSVKFVKIVSNNSDYSLKASYNVLFKNLEDYNFTKIYSTFAYAETEGSLIESNHPNIRLGSPSPYFRYRLFDENDNLVYKNLELKPGFPLSIPLETRFPIEGIGGFYTGVSFYDDPNYHYDINKEISEITSLTTLFTNDPTVYEEVVTVPIYKDYFTKDNILKSLFYLNGVVTKEKINDTHSLTELLLLENLLINNNKYIFTNENFIPTYEYFIEKYGSIENLLNAVEDKVNNTSYDLEVIRVKDNYSLSGEISSLDVDRLNQPDPFKNAEIIDLIVRVKDKEIVKYGYLNVNYMYENENGELVPIMDSENFKEALSKKVIKFNSEDIHNPIVLSDESLNPTYDLSDKNIISVGNQAFRIKEVQDNKELIGEFKDGFETINIIYELIPEEELTETKKTPYKTVYFGDPTKEKDSPNEITQPGREHEEDFFGNVVTLGQDEIIKVGTKPTIKEIDFDRRIVTDPNKPVRYKEVTIPGKKGTETTTYTVNPDTGEVTILNTDRVDPVTEVITVGTKEEVEVLKQYNTISYIENEDTTAFEESLVDTGLNAENVITVTFDRYDEDKGVITSTEYRYGTSTDRLIQVGSKDEETITEKDFTTVYRENPELEKGLTREVQSGQKEVTVERVINKVTPLPKNFSSLKGFYYFDDSDGTEKYVDTSNWTYTKDNSYPNATIHIYSSDIDSIMIIEGTVEHLEHNIIIYQKDDKVFNTGTLDFGYEKNTETTINTTQGRSQIIEVGTKPTTREIPFDRKEVTDLTKPLTYREVTTPGENGIETTTYTVNPDTGEITPNVIVTKDPVTEITTIGTGANKTVPFETRYEADPESPVGTRTTVTPGENGEADVTGKVLRDPVTEVIKIGTKSTTKEIPFDRKEVTDSTKPLTYREVTTPGITGIETTTYAVNPDTGETTSNVVITKDPVTEITTVGVGDNKTVPFETRYEADPTKPAGEKETVIPGETGETDVTGKVFKDPVTEVIKVGTQPTTRELPFNRETVEDLTKPLTYREITTPGEVGIETTTYTVNPNTGEVTPNVVVTKDPVTEITTIGTGANKTVPFETKYVADSDSPVGTRTTVTPGENGETDVTGTVLKDPVTEIIKIGTKSTTREIPFERKEVIDSTKPDGYREVTTPGVIGIETTTYTVNPDTGEVSSTTNITTEKVDEITTIGKAPIYSEEWTGDDFVGDLDNDANVIVSVDRTEEWIDNPYVTDLPEINNYTIIVNVDGVQIQVSDFDGITHEQFLNHLNETTKDFLNDGRNLTQKDSIYNGNTVTLNFNSPDEYKEEWIGDDFVGDLDNDANVIVSVDRTEEWIDDPYVENLPEINNYTIVVNVDGVQIQVSDFDGITHEQFLNHLSAITESFLNDGRNLIHKESLYNGNTVTLNFNSPDEYKEEWTGDDFVGNLDNDANVIVSVDRTEEWVDDSYVTDLPEIDNYTIIVNVDGTQIQVSDFDGITYEQFLNHLSAITESFLNDGRNLIHKESLYNGNTVTLNFSTPKVDTPKDEPKVDTPKDEPKVETPKVETPKDEPKVETPKDTPVNKKTVAKELPNAGDSTSILTSILGFIPLIGAGYISKRKKK